MTSQIPLTIFLCWPEKDILALSPLVHLIWTSLMDRMVETYDDLVKRLGEELARKKCKPVLAVLDEIGTTGFPKLPQYAATVAGRNISLLPVFQSFSQIDSHYKEKADELLDNIEVHVVYRPGSYRSAQKLSGWLGDKSGYAHSENKHESGVSEGMSEQRIPLMTAQTIKKLGNEEVMVFYRDLDPFVTRRLDWRRFPILRQRQAMAPPQLPVLPPLDEQRAAKGTWSNSNPTSSWRLEPNFLRWGSLPAASNGLRK